MNPIKEVDIESVSASDGMSLGSKFDYDDDDDDHTSRSPMDSSGHDGQTMNSSGYLAAEYTPRQRQLAAKEIQTVRRIKLFVVTSLLVLTTSVALGAYFLSANQEFWDFEAQYQEDATKLLQTVGKNLVLTLSAADAFTVSITSLAAATNQSWPFVVVPDFAVRAEKIRTLANAILVNTYPIVAPEERAEWEDFTARTGKAQVDEVRTD